MVEREQIEIIINTIIGQSNIIGKCKRTIDEAKFNSLKTNEEIAEFFGLEYLPQGRLGTEGEVMDGVNKNIAFYDKRNNVTISFITDETYKIPGLDFDNNHVEGDYGDEYVVNLKDVIRAYYEAPYSLKKSTWLINFEKGSNLFTGGDCSMYGVNIYRGGLWGDVREVLYHEMSHALSFQYLDWRNGEDMTADVLPEKLRSRWEKATKEDYKYQEEHGLHHQDTTEYGEENPMEDFAEMGTTIASKLTGANYTPNSHYKFKVEDDSPSGYHYELQNSDDIIRCNPNRAKLMRELMSTGKNIDGDNKQEYIDTILDKYK